LKADEKYVLESVEPIPTQAQFNTAYTINSGLIAKADLSNEASIRQSVAKVKADLRSIATALESYYVDWNKYPTNLNNLTTPIAYLTQVFGDPFAKGNESLQVGVTENSDNWKAYSVGPDQIDDDGEIIYDPTNGTISKGDIIREKQ